ncbi:hypothetical protein Btru_047305 [Bulinus truncatus]|nr:hypothetical protein Btru_047305 [Bulinus truncatus]
MQSILRLPVFSLSSHLLLSLCVLVHGHFIPQTKYIVIIDAGGSSSKLRIYNWTLASNSNIPNVRNTFVKNFSPGISSFEKNINGLKSYMNDTLVTAKSQIPQALYHETPIYLMATAGMRLVDNKDQLLDSTRSLLKDPKLNPFVYTSGSVEILSGEEESVYAWVAVNYLLGKFNNPDTPERSFAGIMELGSRSTQIAFIPREPLLSEEFHVVVAGRLFQLYAQSYLQLGTDGLQLRVADRVCGECGDTVIESPCTISGDKSNITFETSQHKTVIGSYNLHSCLQVLKSLVAPKHGMECEPRPCAIGGVYQPSVKGITFYATQAFTYSPSFFKAYDVDNVTLDLNVLKHRTEEYCNKSIQDVAPADKTFASTNCLVGQFLPILLNESYGFPLDTKQIKATSKFKLVIINKQQGNSRLMFALPDFTHKPKIIFRKQHKTVNKFHLYFI